MSTYKQFAAHIQKHGLARTNRFKIIIPLPEKLNEKFNSVSASPNKSKLAEAIGSIVKVVRIFTGPGNTEFTRGLEIMCMQTELPGKTINTSEGKYNGDVFKVGSSITYGNQQFTFKVSQDMYEKNILDAWMNLIVDPITHEVGYFKDYAVSITVFQLDAEDNITHGVILHDAFPVMTNPMVLSNAEMNNVHELMTQFAYKRWENYDVSQEKDNFFGSLSRTPLGPYLTPILSNPVVQRGLEYLKQNTGLDLEGEGVNVYNQVNKIIENSVGLSAGRTVSLINKTKVSMESNNKVTPNDKSKLSTYINGALNIFGG
jgi:hypothetical protein